MSAICPECDSPIDVDQYDVDIGDELTCSECGTLLRVSNDAPLEFEAADDDDEDLDDDEEDEAEEAEETDDDGDDEFDDDDDEDDDYRDEDE
jgi:alpha-aminoadipate/glutamate carrier protein LysW